MIVFMDVFDDDRHPELWSLLYAFCVTTTVACVHRSVAVAGSSFCMRLVQVMAWRVV